MRAALVLSCLLATLPGCKRADGGESGTTSPADAIDLDVLESPERDAWAKPDEVVGALTIPRADMHIADIGSGSGYFTRRIARRVPEGLVYAIDVDGRFKQFIEQQREAWATPNIESRLALYENPLLPVASLDGVFMSNTYPYIQDRVTYFQGVRDSLREGGWLVIVGFHADASCEGAVGCPGPEGRVPADEVEEELTEAGFELVRTEDFLPHQYFLEFRKSAAPSDAESPAAAETSASAPADADAAVDDDAS